MKIQGVNKNSRVKIKIARRCKKKKRKKICDGAAPPPKRDRAPPAEITT